MHRKEFNSGESSYVSKGLTHQPDKWPQTHLPQEIEAVWVLFISLTLHELMTFLMTNIQENIIWKTSRGWAVNTPAWCEGCRVSSPFKMYCNFSWKHFVKSLSYIVAPKYETTGPLNHTKQLCPQRKGHLLQSCFFLLLKKRQAMLYVVLMTGCCLLYHQAAITSGQGNCHYLESIYLSDLQER